MQGLQLDVSLLGNVCQIDCGINVSFLSVSGTTQTAPGCLTTSRVARAPSGSLTVSRSTRITLPSNIFSPDRRTSVMSFSFKSSFPFRMLQRFSFSIQQKTPFVKDFYVFLPRAANKKAAVPFFAVPRLKPGVFYGMIIYSSLRQKTTGGIFHA